MDSAKIILNVQHDGGAKIISVDSNTRFVDIKFQVSSKWIDLVNSGFSFLYSIGGVSNCSIDNDLDVCNLLVLCDMLSAKIVDINIVLTDTSDASVQKNTNENSSMDGVDSDTDQDSDGCDAEGGRDYDNVMGGNQYMGDGLNCDGDDFDVFGDIMKHGDMGNGGGLKCGTYNNANRSRLGGNVDKVGCMPSYDVCPNLKKKPLLSDEWVNILDGGVGTVFDNGASEFRIELIKYSQQMGFRFKYTKNNKRYIYARCREWEECACQWHIKAKLQQVTNAFVVTRANLDHTCIGNMVGDKNRRLGSKIAGNLIVQDVKAKPKTRGKDVMNTLRIGYGIHVPYWKARRTYEAAMNQIFGSYDDSYDQLRWYCDAIKRTNPGSVVELEVERKTNRFLRVFIAFKACLDGFKKCRPMLFIDGTFMTGRAKGTLLGATAKDGNNGLFPVAIAIVSAENKDNWKWFLEKICDVATHDLQICYISDRNTGLMAAFPLVWDKPLHFFCMFHLLTNLKGKFSKGWTNVQRENLCVHFKDCAYAPNVRLFKEKISIFKNIGGRDAEEWMEDLPKEKWAVAYSLHIKRYGEMTSNAAEQFNAWIKEARSLPVTLMLDHIRKGICVWIFDRRLDCSKWTGALCPRKEKIWNILIDISRSWVVQQCPSGVFEVLSHPNAVVDIRKGTCSCYQWQVRGFPCAHAAAVISRKCPTVYSIVEECFLTKNYRACYSYDIHAIPESEKYEFQPENESQSKILPPLLNRKPGRPREKRKPSFGESRKKKHIAMCSCCGHVANHDPTTCILHPGEGSSGSM